MEVDHIYSEQYKKKHLGEGPWVQEPDYIEFEHEGIKCFVIRNFGPVDKMGNLCGYCVLPNNHPWIDKEKVAIETEVHGGITFSEDVSQGWAIGFDCCHPMDVIPGYEKIAREAEGEYFDRLKKLIETMIEAYGKPEKTYKTVDFVIAECKKLAEEINKAR